MQSKNPMIPQHHDLLADWQSADSHIQSTPIIQNISEYPNIQTAPKHFIAASFEPNYFQNHTYCDTELHLKLYLWNYHLQS